jgi:DNA-binding NtrC family response regulator
MIALLVQNQCPADELTSFFDTEEVKVDPRIWEHTLRGLSPSGKTDKAALIMPASSFIAICERTKEARSLLGAETHLLVSAPPLTENERLDLTLYGANTIIKPRTDSPKHIAERIIGELFLQGVRESSFGSICGATWQMRQLYSDIKMLAKLKYPVLILGETGTGKDLIAKEIHRHSARSGQFCRLNCAEFSPELLRSELFGHVKGSFTGANQDKQGLIMEAADGTLFLDEIGDLDIESQAMLLHVLEDYKFRPVGANRWKELNARLVLATHRNLEQMIEQGKFRQDLYARINGFPLHAPPLRDRRADIPLLVRHFIDSFNKENPDQQVKIPPGALDCLFESEWPDNVRQLLKVVQKAAVFNSDGNINVALLLKEVSKSRHQGAQPSLNSTSFSAAAGDAYSVGFDPTIDTIYSAVRRIQKAYIEAVLDQANGNKEKAIKHSGLGRSRFYELLRELDIK